jgi:HlyD family secretion protein
MSMSEIAKLRFAATRPSPEAVVDSAGNQPARVVLECSGVLQPARSVIVGVDVTGRVSEVLCQEGQRVRAGSLLAQLESTAARLELSLAEARLRLAMAESPHQNITSNDATIRQLKSQLQEAMLREEQLQAEVQAACIVLTSDSPLSAMNQALEKLTTLNEQLDQCKRQIAELQNQLKQELQQQSEQRQQAARTIDPQTLLIAQAKVELAQAEVLRQRHQLERLRIRAPFAGTITRRCVEPGTVVVPGVNHAICELADCSNWFVEVSIWERDLDKIKPQQACRIMLVALPTLTLFGQVEQITPSVDRKTHMVRVRIAVRPTHEFRKLIPNMSAIVRFLAPADTASDAAATATPNDATPDATATAAAPAATANPTH